MKKWDTIFFTNLDECDVIHCGTEKYRSSLKCTLSLETQVIRRIEFEKIRESLTLYFNSQVVTLFRMKHSK